MIELQLTEQEAELIEAYLRTDLLTIEWLSKKDTKIIQNILRKIYEKIQ
jgi:hypothetical protein